MSFRYTQVIAERLETVVEHLGGIGLQIARRDPLWPPGAAEERLMPLQRVGLAAIHGADFHKDPGQFDPDVAKQIERGLSWRGVEVAAALGASSAISAAFAAFFCEFDLLLVPTVPCVAWPLVQLGPKNDRREAGKSPSSCRLHTFRKSRTTSSDFNPVRP